MEKKITKAQMFTAIREVVIDNKEMVDFIDHELELLAKKSASKKPTKTQEANEGIKDTILTVLGTFENGATVSEIIKADTALAGFSNQKISALVNKLVADGKVKKEIDKNKSLFFLV